MAGYKTRSLKDESLRLLILSTGILCRCSGRVLIGRMLEALLIACDLVLVSDAMDLGLQECRKGVRCTIWPKSSFHRHLQMGPGKYPKTLQNKNAV